jgi:hypothetical protein
MAGTKTRLSAQHKEFDPILSLWLSVLIQSVLDLKIKKYRQTAFQWLNDKENIVFEMLAESLDYSPEGLRKLIFENLLTYN